ncbi:hypothetical protein ACN4GA_20085 [Raoultella terrigena]
MLEKINEQRIEPHKVTKPIQLLAAWMVGLVVTNSSFLIAASQMTDHSWEKGFLVVAAVINVPVFLFALFLLQTRFRAELQEDTYYSEYLSKKTSTPIKLDKNTEQDARIERVERLVSQLSAQKIEQDNNVSAEGELDWTEWPVGLNRYHPNFKEIKAALKAAKIPITSYFGRKEKLPSRWVISLSRFLPITHKTAILRELISFKFDGFQLWEPMREAEENEDVYIGSYGSSPVAPINNELRELLRQDDIEASELDFLYEINS